MNQLNIKLVHALILFILALALKVYIFLIANRL